MDTIEKRARELLVTEYKDRGELVHAFNIERGGLSCMYAAEIAAIIAALTPQWQPIESAPKDGTAVLVMQNNWPGCKNGVAEECSGHNTYVAAWWADERGGAGAWICYMDAVRDPECPIQPTHWQPLPAPPEVP